jgi:hypothetical protein
VSSFDKTILQHKGREVEGHMTHDGNVNKKVLIKTLKSNYVFRVKIILMHVSRANQSKLVSVLGCL